ncbi:hypothetical protein [Paenibacillus alkalitolerans]|nr:hypothetical protein [Paenibacillus alkalitolerans]
MGTSCRHFTVPYDRRLEEWMIQVVRGIIVFQLEHNVPKKQFPLPY